MLSALATAAFAAAVATAAFAAEPPSVATEEGGTATEVQPVPVTAKAASAISFAACHFEHTPPHDPHRRLECPAGEVVVAVYEQGVRCCSLELR